MGGLRVTGSMWKPVQGVQQGCRPDGVDVRRAERRASLCRPEPVRCRAHRAGDRGWRTGGGGNGLLVRVGPARAWAQVSRRREKLRRCRCKFDRYLDFGFWAVNEPSANPARLENLPFRGGSASRKADLALRIWGQLAVRFTFHRLSIPDCPIIGHEVDCLFYEHWRSSYPL